MAAVVYPAWWPIMKQETGMELDVYAILAWATCTVLFGLLFAKLFDVLDFDLNPSRSTGLDLGFRTGRSHTFRR